MRSMCCLVPSFVHTALDASPRRVPTLQSNLESPTTFVPPFLWPIGVFGGLSRWNINQGGLSRWTIEVDYQGGLSRWTIKVDYQAPFGRLSCSLVSLMADRLSWVVDHLGSTVVVVCNESGVKVLEGTQMYVGYSIYPIVSRRFVQLPPTRRNACNLLLGKSAGGHGLKAKKHSGCSYLAYPTEGQCLLDSLQSFPLQMANALRTPLVGSQQTNTPAIVRRAHAPACSMNKQITAFPSCCYGFTAQSGG